MTKDLGNVQQETISEIEDSDSDDSESQFADFVSPHGPLVSITGLPKKKFLIGARGDLLVLTYVSSEIINVDSLPRLITVQYSKPRFKRCYVLLSTGVRLQVNEKGEHATYLIMSSTIRHSGLEKGILIQPLLWSNLELSFPKQAPVYTTIKDMVFMVNKIPDEDEIAMLYAYAQVDLVKFVRACKVLKELPSFMNLADAHVTRVKRIVINKYGAGATPHSIYRYSGSGHMALCMYGSDAEFLSELLYMLLDLTKTLSIISSKSSSSQSPYGGAPVVLLNPMKESFLSRYGPVSHSRYEYDEAKSSLPLLPDDINFKGDHFGRQLIVKRATKIVEDIEKVNHIRNVGEFFYQAMLKNRVEVP